MRKSLLLLVLSFILSVPAFAANYYWVGGSGNWNDPMHWSLTSGGASAAILPGVSDNVIFDNNSGLLTVADIVSLNTNVTIDTLDFSGVSNNFGFDSPAPVSFEIQGSIFGNASGANFTGAWGEITLNATVPGETISSLGTIWTQDFRIIGNAVSLVDDFTNGNGNFYVDFGGLNTGANSLTCGAFFSTMTSARVLDLTSSRINVLNGYWEIDTNNLTWNGLASAIYLEDNAGLAQFLGGGLIYDTLRSTTATDLELYASNNFALFEVLPSSNFQVENGATLRTDSLIAFGSCTVPLNITTTAPGVNASIEKTGFPLLSINSAAITDVDATGPATFEVFNSTLVNAANWTPAIGVHMYWIGDGGNWGDGSHWSFSSGGAPSGCIPSASDSVFFDQNSFTLPNQTVLADVHGDFKTMDWSQISTNQVLALDSSLHAYGDITLHPNLTMQRTFIGGTIVFEEQSTYTNNNATVDAIFELSMDIATDSLLLADDLRMSDTSVIILFQGTLITQDNYLKSGSLLSFNNQSTAADLRTLEFGNSTIELVQRFSSIGDTNLVLNAGTSHLYIGDTVQYVPVYESYPNALASYGHIFYDVTLNFNALGKQQLVNGNNTFNKLTILPGSQVSFEELTTQTINDSLLLEGKCDEMIQILTSDSSNVNQANINLVNDMYSAEVLVVKGLNAAGIQPTIFHSIDSLGNTGWIFDTTPAVTASFSVNQPSYCLGDTTEFTNLSTVQTGQPTDLTSQWYFQDGSTGFWSYVPPPVDSVFITYEVDTTEHLYTTGGVYQVQLITVNNTNRCTDTAFADVTIYEPSINLSYSTSDTTICLGEEVVFEAVGDSSTAQFEYFLNGVSVQGPSSDSLYTTISLSDQDTVSVLGYDGGCPSDTMPSFIYTVFDLPVFNFTTSDIDFTICEKDSVYFTAIQPTEPSYAYQFQLNGAGVTWFVDSAIVWGVDTLANNDIISAIVLDTLGCSDTMAMTFTVDPLPTTSLASSVVGNVICAGDLVTFTGSGADLYEFFVNGMSVQGPSATNFYATTLTSTDTVTVNGVSTAGCDSLAAESYFYIVNPIPATTLVSSDIDNSICSGETVTFTASGAGTFEFFVNGASVQFGSNPTYVTNTLADGDIVHVDGILGACAIASSSFNMTVLASPTTALTNNDNGDNTICLGTPVVFTATGATNYEFFVDGSNVQGPSPVNTFTTSGLIDGQEVMVVGEANSCLVPQSQTFSVLNNPVVSFFSSDIDNTICDGDLIEFIGANAGSYEFFVNGASVQGPSPATILSNPALNIGVNQVEVVGIAGNGCTDTSATINITVNAIPIISLTSSDANNIICANEEVTFTGSGGDMYQFFIGATPQGALSPTSNFTTSNLLNGQTVTISGSLLGCPSSSNAITTTVHPIPTTSLVSTDIDNVYCESDFVDYTAGGAANYEFFVDGISQGAPSPINTINSSGFPTSTFPLTVVGDANGCFDTTEVTVVINTTPIASLSNNATNNTICQGESVTHTAAGGSIYEYFINGATQGTPTVNSSIVFPGLSNGDVISVEVTTPQGCSSNDAMLPIVVNPTPATVLTSSDPNQEICIGENVDFTGAGANEYEFFINGTSQGPPGTNPVFSTTGLSNGDNITVIGMQLGCSNTSNNLNFTVYGYPAVSLFNNGDNEICVGENTDLTALGATNYQFLINSVPFGPFSPVNSFTAPLNNGDVVTVVGETNGCASNASNSFAFTVNTYPTTSSSVNPGTTICLNDTVTVLSSGASEYQFEINGTIEQFGVSTTFETSALEDGDVITVIGFNGDCPSVPEVFNFTVNTMNLDLIVSPSSLICEGDPVIFTASGADEYEFSINGSVVAPMSTTNTYVSSTISDQDEVTFTGFSATTFCVQEYEDFILMNVPDAPAITASSSTDFCEGDSVVLISNGSYGNQWYVDGQPIANAIDTSIVVYASGDYSLGTTAGGQGDVWSFGMNATGVFGNGNNFNYADPTAAETTVPFDALSAGDGFVIGISETDELFAWGENSSGQLGDGTYTSTNLPQVVPTMVDIRSVATAKSSIMAVTNTSEVYVWGNNTQGQLGTGNLSIITFPFLNANLSNTDSIAAGEDHFVILRNDGTVWTVGNNNYGQLGQGNITSSNVPVQVTGLTNAVAVGAGEYCSFAILNSGELYVWGNNSSGQLGLGDFNNRLNATLLSLDNIVAAEGGATHSVFLSNNNKVYTSGGNSFGQLGDGTQTDKTTPQMIAVSGVEKISVGQYTSLMYRNDHSVFGCGSNVESQLSSSNGTIISTPEHIQDLDGVVSVEAGKFVSHFIAGIDQTCNSPVVQVNVNPLPTATITATDDTLSTIAGASYQWYFEGNPIPGAVNQTHPANESGNYSVEVTLANGCTSFSDTYYHSMSAVDDLMAEQINVFPNPSHGIFQVELGTVRADIYVLDVAGKVVWEQSDATGVTLVDLTKFERAMYLMSIQADDSSITKKLIRN